MHKAQIITKINDKIKLWTFKVNYSSLAIWQATGGATEPYTGNIIWVFIKLHKIKSAFI